MKQKQPRITLYSSSGCCHCRQLKAWLKQHELPFREFDIQRNARAFKDFHRLGGRGVPLLLVGGQKIQGFNASKLPAQLRRAGVDL